MIDAELRGICEEALEFGLSPYDAATTAVDRAVARGDVEHDDVQIELAFIDFETRCDRLFREIEAGAWGG